MLNFHPTMTIQPDLVALLDLGVDQEVQGDQEDLYHQDLAQEVGPQ